MATLPLPPVFEQNAPLPIATLLTPVVLAHMLLSPMATWPEPEVLPSKALQPRAELLPSVQPTTVPKVVGVAGARELVTQQRPVAVVEQATRTWPLVPTASSPGVQAAVPAIKEPFAVRTDF